MEKLLRQAMEYSPDKLTEFLSEYYHSLRIDQKAVLKAKLDTFLCESTFTPTCALLRLNGLKNKT